MMNSPPSVIQHQDDPLYEELTHHLQTIVCDLRNDLDVYWPWVNGSRLHESNLTFHLARLARNSGLIFFSEVPIAKEERENQSSDTTGKPTEEGITGKRQAFDGLILDPKRGRGVIVECKSFGSNTVTSVNSDLSRMQMGNEPERWDEVDPSCCLDDGLLLLHTFDPAIWDWWQGGFIDDLTPERKKVDSAWAPCRNILFKGLRGGGNIISPGSSEHRWLLWVLFKRRHIKQQKNTA